MSAPPLAGLGRDSVPLNLMSAHFKNHLFYSSNHRLEEAKAKGLTLDDIFIGDDCLTTWADRAWDPTQECLHDVIQAQLCSHEEVWEAGILAAQDVVFKSNRKLAEARALADEAIQFLYQDGIDEHDEHEDSSSPEENDMEYVAASIATPVGEIAGASSSDASMTMDLASPYTSDSSSDSDSDSDNDDDNYFGMSDGELFDDEFSVDNLFDAEPLFLDSDDDDEPNVFHDAQVLGLPKYLANVDLELYIAEDEDDDEIDDLPEMELAIDQEAYERLFGIDGAVDLEIEGGRIICTGELFEEDQEMILDEMSDDSTLDLEEGEIGEWDQVGEGEEMGDGDLLNDLENDAADAAQPEAAEDMFLETEEGLEW
ncbi:hypothetical protein F53441_1532 [Fusarium austroafricanum]|uniref:Uncharacterized protein n=1 Tax=Fusarium austroafricanum TaxID=2364996 RepID=A0A8H4KU79_9HYPO|nr:hypothetical protein F53441_1532 [Fusarium austroafricanum]